jgi:predicted NUDIX family NTP pyrophosphohydrolase
MKNVSAGILLYRSNNGLAEVFLVHPGGPFFKNKDEGSWTIPKGLVEDEENLFDTAKREFEEETGVTDYGNFISLGSIVQKGGKKVFAWGAEYNSGKPINIISNNFEIE